MTTCFGQRRPSSGHQEPGYALYNIMHNQALDDLKTVFFD